MEFMLKRKELDINVYILIKMMKMLFMLNIMI